MNISNAHILVTGGTGGLGEGIVRSLMRQGGHILVPTRHPEKLDALRKYVADITTGSLNGVTGSLSTPDEAQQLGRVLLAACRSWPDHHRSFTDFTSGKRLSAQLLAVPLKSPDCVCP